MVLAAGATVHVLWTKEDPRAAAGWLGLLWLSPALGAFLYLMLGINRVQRKAVALRRAPQHPRAAAAHVTDVLPAEAAHLGPLRRAVDGLQGAPLQGGNRVELLRDGDEAYPAMLAAIEAAERTVVLQTFLWDDDAWGRRFVDALAGARARGVEVRVLVDGVGVWFSGRSPAFPHLVAAGIEARRFLYHLDPRRMALLNLRNHRKILVVDGRVGFTGGMNVRGSFVQEGPGPRTAEQDLHVRVEGPVVAALVDVFAQDWAFETDERLDGPLWRPDVAPAGGVPARVVTDGPDDHEDPVQLVLIEAIACARQRVLVQTPYFLPEEPLQTALVAAARRGLVVEVLVPSPSNHAIVDAAMRADLPRLLDHGVRVLGVPPPFDHGKLVVVDDAWSCLGSFNWDPRSLRLNFELLLEVYGAELAGALVARFAEVRARATPFTAEALRARPAGARLVERAARVLRPYL